MLARLRHSAAILALALSSSAIAAAPAKPLQVVAIDVEGGAATLYVTPQGHSLLIDTGWAAGVGGKRPAPGAPPPPPTPSSAERIAATLRQFGLDHLDYLLITHYHADHVGGAPELMALIPVGTVIDHGPNREALPADTPPARAAGAPATLYPRYLAAVGTRPHRVMKPGETLRIDDLTLTAVDSDGEILSAPLAEGGSPGANCAAATTNDKLGGEENPRSLGVLIRWGKARLLSLGDTTWNMENRLACPRDLIGPVDLMFADNHGTDNANSPNLVNTVKPRIMIFGNGATKGADAASLDTAKASPRIEGIWQVHFAERSPDKNAPAAHIANLPDSPDAMNPLRIAVSKSGAIAITNPRTGATETYAAK